MVYVPLMTPARTFLGVTRALIGIGSWIAPDQTARLFGIDPTRSDRFIGRLFGARELALAGALLVAPDSAVVPVAAVGVAVDAADAAPASTSAGAATSQPRRPCSVRPARCYSSP